MTRITFQTQYGTAIVEVPQDDMSIEDIFVALVEPVLLASGYSQILIDSYLDAPIK